MRIALLSDLHLEFEANQDRPDAAAGHPYRSALSRKITLGPDLTRLRFAQPDVVVLAGDIDVGNLSLRYARMARDYLRTAIVLVPGNHEFYGASLEETRKELRDKASQYDQIFLLDNTVAMIGGIRFIGSTLWSGFSLFGDSAVEATMHDVAGRLNDYEFIHVTQNDEQFKPEDALLLHQEARTFLELELSNPGPNIVVTHHAPHPMSIPQKAKGRKVSAAYATDLSEFIYRYSPLYWLHGHIHSKSDYRLGRTGVMCNPRGYYPHSLVEQFDPCGAMFDVTLVR